MGKCPSKADPAQLERMADQLVGRTQDCLTRHQLEHRRRREVPTDPNRMGR